MLDVHAEEIAESISILDNWPFIKKMFNNALIYADINGPEFAIEFFKKITKNIC